MPRLAVLSDTNPVITARLTRMLVHHEPAALLFAGDHHPTRFGVTRRSARNWRRSIGDPLRDNVLAVPGNHDHDPETGLEGWLLEFHGTCRRGWCGRAARRVSWRTSVMCG